MQTQMNKSGISMSLTLNGDTIEGHNKLGNSINVTMSASGFSITEHFGKSRLSPSLDMRWNTRERAVEYFVGGRTGHGCPIQLFPCDNYAPTNIIDTWGGLCFH